VEVDRMLQGAPGSDPGSADDGDDTPYPPPAWWRRVLCAALHDVPVFPIPQIPEPPRPASGRSRRVLRRYLLARDLCAIANRCLAAINELEGSASTFSAARPPPRRVRRQTSGASLRDAGVAAFHSFLLRSSVSLRDGRRA